MENIYQQAVLDAKAVRASAMANAKATIQEAFEPKIKAMLKKHIVESEEDELDELMGSKKAIHAAEKESDFKKIAKKQVAEDYEDEMDEYGDEHHMPTKDALDMHEDYEEEDEDADPSMQEDPGNLDETALDEILAELEAMTQDESDEEDEMDESLNESEEEDELDEAKDEEEDEEDAEEEAEEDEDEDGEATGDETKVVDITLGDLVDAIKAAMATENGAEMADADASEDDNISLDEILAELEDESEEDEMDEYGADGGYLSEKKKDKERIVKTGKAAVKASEKETSYSKELEEAKKAIAAMRSELNEVNLLNAKLLYVNKIFKSKSLTESQKVKVLNAFDRATTVKEVKNVYATINESVSAAPKKQLKESYGFASKPTGYTQKTNTVESDPFIARMQKLAGL